MARLVDPGNGDIHEFADDDPEIAIAVSHGWRPHAPDAGAAFNAQQPPSSATRAAQTHRPAGEAFSREQAIKRGGYEPIMDPRRGKIGEEDLPVPDYSRPIPSGLDALLLHGADSASLGVIPKVAAAVGPGDYKENRALGKQQMADAAEEHPGLATAGTIGGALATGRLLTPFKAAPIGGALRTGINRIGANVLNTGVLGAAEGAGHSDANPLTSLPDAGRFAADVGKGGYGGLKAGLAGELVGGAASKFLGGVANKAMGRTLARGSRPTTRDFRAIEGGVKGVGSFVNDKVAPWPWESMDSIATKLEPATDAAGAAIRPVTERAVAQAGKPLLDVPTAAKAADSAMVDRLARNRAEAGVNEDVLASARGKIDQATKGYQNQPTALPDVIDLKRALNIASRRAGGFKNPLKAEPELAAALETGNYGGVDPAIRKALEGVDPKLLAEFEKQNLGYQRGLAATKGAGIQAARKDANQALGLKTWQILGPALGGAALYGAGKGADATGHPDIGTLLEVAGGHHLLQNYGLQTKAFLARNAAKLPGGRAIGALGAGRGGSASSPAADADTVASWLKSIGR